MQLKVLEKASVWVLTYIFLYFGVMYIFSYISVSFQVSVKMLNN